MSQSEYSLLAELALRIGRSPEDIATEALTYILSRSEAARHGIQQLADGWVRQPLRRITSFRSQVTSPDNSRPDIEAHDDEGNPVVILENKFWAGLTDAQPGAYLHRLEGQGGALCFVAPELRLRYLWPELIRRAAAEFPDLQVESDDSHIKLARVRDNLILGLASWPFLLGHVQHALEGDGDTALLADLRQLMGLVRRMDSVGFLPFTVTDLTGPTARLVMQYCRVIDAIVDALLQEPWASKKGLKASAGAGWYGHYVLRHEYGCQLTFNAPLWSEHGGSPLWLRISSPEWRYSEAIETAVSRKVGAWPLFVLRDGYTPGVYTAIPIREGCEFDDVVAECVRHVSFLATEIARLAPPATGAAPCPDPVMP